MLAIHRKLLRDLAHMKGQVIAICVVIACGIATFVMSLSTLASLRETRAVYYERYRFPHLFVSLKRAPETLRRRLEEIPGVRAVELRIVSEVTLDMPGMDEPAVGRLISIPETHRPGLCNLHLRAGRYVEAGRDDEVIVSEAFADAHELKPGDSRSQRFSMGGCRRCESSASRSRPNMCFRFEALRCCRTIAGSGSSGWAKPLWRRRST
jgi:putative ABC transport system permease protein